jgi:replicative DNA helicase
MRTPSHAIFYRAFMSMRDGELAYIVENVDPSEFNVPVERRLFIALVNASIGQRGIGLTTFGNSLALRDAEAAALFTEICSTPLEEDDEDDVIEALVSVFHEWSATAKLRILTTHASEQLERRVPAAHVRLELENALTALDLTAIDGRRYDDVVAQAEDITAFLSSDGEQGVPFGYAKLDANVTPLGPGNLAIVAGATGSGKSTVARNFVRNWERAGRRVAIMSLEMSAREQWLNLACMMAGIDVGAALSRALDPESRVRLWEAVRSCQSGGLRINDRAYVTPEYLLRTLRRYRAEGFDTFVLDHLHRVEYGAKNEQQDLRLRMGALARALKSFAMDTQAIVVALAQLVKKPRSDEPDDSHIRETAQIAEESDKVFFVYRPDVAHERRLDGSLRPIDRDGVLGHRFFAADAPQRSVLAPDDTRVYIKLGKQRIRPRTALISIAFDASTGRMFDSPAPAQLEAIA